MKEFGSDYHFINNFSSSTKNIFDEFYPNHILLANGRQSLIYLVKLNRWKRIWLPQYYCYEVVNSLSALNIEIAFYLDYPGFDERKIVNDISFKEGDVLLRINYFGLRGFRSEKNIPVPVIEDHSHDLLGEWARKSDAVWCIASLRKTLPIAEGGILWSPLNNHGLTTLDSSFQNNELATKRWKAMRLKSDYLNESISNKSAFRDIMIETENSFDDLPLSGIDSYTKKFISSFDILKWYQKKCDNWRILSSYSFDSFKEIRPFETAGNIFSWLILTSNKRERDNLKSRLIENSIYPAVLWNVPATCHPKVVDFSHRMLSIHCDARYTEQEMKELLHKLKQID